MIENCNTTIEVDSVVDGWSMMVHEKKNINKQLKWAKFYKVVF